jgi:hypothetical protein
MHSLWARDLDPEAGEDHDRVASLPGGLTHFGATPRSSAGVPVGGE